MCIVIFSFKNVCKYKMLSFYTLRYMCFLFIRSVDFEIQLHSGC